MMNGLFCLNTLDCRAKGLTGVWIAIVLVKATAGNFDPDPVPLFHNVTCRPKIYIIAVDAAWLN